MNTSKNLLFPFSTDSAYFESYSWAASLSARMDATLRLLTTSPQPQSRADQHNTIYCSLLEAHGYYLEHYQQEETRRPKIIREPMTAVGDLGENLLACLGKVPADIVIIDKPFAEKYRGVVKKLIKGPAGLIILGSRTTNKRDSTKPASFYQQLMEANVYNLPTQFFSELGKDTSVYNYLRKLFQKSFGNQSR